MPFKKHPLKIYDPKLYQGEVINNLPLKACFPRCGTLTTPDFQCYKYNISQKYVKVFFKFFSG